MRCFMCEKRAMVICMCASPRVIICFEHLRNHTGGRSFHRLRNFEAYQNQQLTRLAIKTINSIKQHVISATVKKIQGQANNQIKKLSLTIESKQRMQIIQEIIQSNEKIQLKTQRSLQWLAEFKEGVYKMREQIIKDVIERHCVDLMKIFALDCSVKNKVRVLYKENVSRFAGIVEIFIGSGIYEWK